MNEASRKQIELTPQLFTPLTTLSTITQGYESSSKETIEEIPGLSLPNTHYNNYTSTFHIDDTIKLSKSKNLYCNPSNFGYSIKDGEFVFPNYTYPQCTKINKEEYPEMSFDYEKNLLIMKCKKGNPYYILEPVERKGRLFNYHELLNVMIANKYTKPVKLTVEDFAFGSCDGVKYNNALHFPRFNKTLYEQASEKMKELQIKHKPLIVILLTIDSYSRRHFFRKMPKTVEFLNNMNPSFAVFDFKIHNVLGASSTDNMVPVFTGNY